jgi:hypothetical protein
MGISKVFPEEPASSTASDGLSTTVKKQAPKEYLVSVDEFLEKAKSEIHYELWPDIRPGPPLIYHLTISALAEDGHILKIEVLKHADQKVLCRVLADLETRYNFTATPGKWY